MNTLHRKILELLGEIDDICRKYDITYYAAGGTTIGAVRHRGFIPWDDDADIYMTRDNFNRFREAFKKENPDGRVLGCLDDNPEYPATIPRYMDDNTAFVAKYHCLNTCAAGIVIDIFILDPVGNTEEEQREHINKLYVYSDLVMPFYVYSYRADDDYLGLYDKYQNRVKKEGKEKIIRELEEELFTLKESDCEYYSLRWGTLPHIFPKEMFGEPVYFDYENMQIPCPHNWYDYLVQLYGPQWMYVPKHIEDEQHDTIVDIEHRYTNYLVDADRYIDKEAARETYQQRKDLYVHREILMRPTQREILDVNSKYTLLSQDIKLDKKGVDIEKLFSAGKYKDIVDAFKPYLDIQFSDDYVGRMKHGKMYRYNNRVFIPLADDKLVILTMSLFMSGAAKRCKDLLLLRKSYGELTDALSEVEKKVNNFYKLYKNFYLGNYDETERILDSFSYSEREKNADILKINLQVQIQKGKDSEEIQRKLDVIIESSADSEYLKIKGDLKLRDGFKEEARELYKQALPNLTNGLMIQDIGDKFEGLEVNYDTPININTLTSLKEKRLELLREINSICESNGIEYHLCNNTLLYGYYLHIIPDDYSSCTMVMTVENALKFMKVCDEMLPESRKVDSMLNNPFHSRFSLIYRDVDTLSIDWRNIEKTKDRGIHVVIYILKKKDANRFRWVYTRFLDILYTVNVRVKSNKHKKQTKHWDWLITGLVKIYGEDRLRNKVFNNYIEGAIKSPNADYYLSKRNTRSSIDKFYSKEYFDGHQTATLYGEEFHVPNHVDDYILKYHGKYAEKNIKVREKQPSGFMIEDSDIKSSEISEFLETIVFSEQNFDAYQKGLALNKDIRKVNAKVRKNWLLIQRGGERFKLFIKYAPMKEQIIEAYRKGEYSEVGDMLKDYDISARKYLNYKLTVLFDKEIFDIYCEMLISKGEREFAEELRKYIPEEHLEPMTIL